jgi:nucleoside recognition membrane protein YjiH
LIAAVVVPRLPPLSMKGNRYIDGSDKPSSTHDVPGDSLVLSFGVQLVEKKLSEIENPKRFFITNLANIIIMIINILPVITVIGIVGLVVAEHTPLFYYMGKPFIPLLQLLKIPEAVEASECIVVGFADMFLPALLTTGIENELTRFFIACMSVTQVIYISETGALLIASKIPVNILELFVIYILRTLVAMPVIAMMAYMIFYIAG